MELKELKSGGRLILAVLNLAASSETYTVNVAGSCHKMHKFVSWNC